MILKSKCAVICLKLLATNKKGYTYCYIYKNELIIQTLSHNEIKKQVDFGLTFIDSYPGIFPKNRYINTQARQFKQKNG